jgi:hypothetical protein
MLTTKYAIAAVTSYANSYHNSERFEIYIIYRNKIFLGVINVSMIRNGFRILMRGMSSDYDILSDSNSLTNQLQNKKINNLTFILT